MKKFALVIFFILAISLPQWIGFPSFELARSGIHSNLGLLMTYPDTRLRAALIPFFDLAVGQCEIKRDEKEISCIMQLLSLNLV